jgi:hypothetical protein
VTPILNSLRQTTWHGSLNPSSGIIRLNVAGIFPLSSEISSAAPVTDRSRIMQGVLIPPYSIFAAFMTRKRGAARVSTMRKTLALKSPQRKAALNGRALIEVIPARMRIIMLGASSQDFVYDAVKLRVPREQRKSHTETTEDLTQHGECNVSFVQIPMP